jgi:hypothetical protein
MGASLQARGATSLTNAVAQGTPPPMLDGVTWVLEQDMTQGAPLYQHVDRDRIAATGHSQGAFAASSAGTGPRIETIAPIETLGASRGLHGPVRNDGHDRAVQRQSALVHRDRGSARHVRRAQDGGSHELDLRRRRRDEPVLRDHDRVVSACSS